MDPSRAYRPRVSRETRLLLVTATVAVVVLWMLARVRFPDQPVAPNPVQPILTQITPTARLDDLAAEIAQLQTRIDPFIPRLPVPALRFRDNLALVLLDDGREHDAAAAGLTVLARDRGTGLAVVQVPTPAVTLPAAWVSDRMQQPRYMMATQPSAAGVSLRPVLIGALEPRLAPPWSGPLWFTPGADLTPGAFLFTSDARLVGMAVTSAGRPAIVPAELLIVEADRLVTQPPGDPGYVGVETAPLTPAVSRATGAASGVVVTWVDPDGPAADVLAAGDVIESAGGDPVRTSEQWLATIARLSPDQPLALRIRRGGETVDLQVDAAAMPEPAARGELGLTLRAVPGVGSEIVRVDPGSMADAAGLEAGDVITRVGDAASPGPAQVRQAVAAAPDGSAILVALSRSTENLVTAFDKP